jgi:hypothetical protein
LAADEADAPPNSASVKLECMGSASVSMDQVYLGPPWTLSGTYF